MVTMERRTDGSALRNTGNQFFYHLTVVFIVDGHGTQAGTDFLGVYQTGMYLRVGKIIEFLTAHFFVFCFHRL